MLINNLTKDIFSTLKYLNLYINEFEDSNLHNDECFKNTDLYWWKNKWINKNYNLYNGVNIS